ncbi:hypothetical protein [Luteibacter yeojuensis]|uniref:Uncharacterized protein n=1 Tax=Luteibacter yeojuensis TaxID=345309 RepID=A0A7X5QVV7_9GAMM|nr:hypothetical protein [Luteibacter yeojuensis]NID16389.1 hypothetical protein [Luteibacter yeojuensis]
MLWMVFAALLNRVSPAMQRSYDHPMARQRYAGLVMLGVHPAPTMMLRILRVVLAMRVILGSMGYLSALYIAFSDGSAPGTCEICQLDPLSKTLRFWLLFCLAAALTVAAEIAVIMVAYQDKYIEEAPPYINLQRIRLGFRLVFSDVPASAGDRVNGLRIACRCVVLIAIIDVLLMIFLPDEILRWQPRFYGCSG